MDNIRQTQIGFEVQLPVPFEQAVEILTAALKSEGFGVLTRIDVKATLKEKLNEDFRPYLILGACNPHLAHRALSHSAEIGLLLPCNATVEEIQSGLTTIRLANPDLLLSIGMDEQPDLRAVAQEAEQKIKNVALGLSRHVEST